MATTITELVDRLTQELATENPGWSEEEILHTVSADTWHEYEQAVQAGNTIVAEMYRRAHTEASKRELEHELLMS